ncbi:hypothetical protein DFH09DRAFT_1085566 [Mycena vulgaris]|nr:hypothetical protein DFH09DRAFT_1085566 [Mycena vulgaris]
MARCDNSTRPVGLTCSASELCSSSGAHFGPLKLTGSSTSELSMYGALRSQSYDARRPRAGRQRHGSDERGHSAARDSNLRQCAQLWTQSLKRRTPNCECICYAQKRYARGVYATRFLLERGYDEAVGHYSVGKQSGRLGDKPEGKPAEQQREVIDTQNDVTESGRLESRQLVPAHEEGSNAEWRNVSIDRGLTTDIKGYILR